MVLLQLPLGVLPWAGEESEDVPAEPCCSEGAVCWTESAMPGNVQQSTHPVVPSISHHEWWDWTAV